MDNSDETEAFKHVQLLITHSEKYWNGGCHGQTLEVIWSIETLLLHLERQFGKDGRTALHKAALAVEAELAEMLQVKDRFLHTADIPGHFRDCLLTCQYLVHSLQIATEVECGRNGESNYTLETDLNHVIFCVFSKKFHGLFIRLYPLYWKIRAGD
eukprot:m.80423 g.80423  ORF g.80423 m.80423 type:complete len:156 (+) comp36193_c0_seq3:79-546(+)